jgi:hypothetical protein
VEVVVELLLLVEMHLVSQRVEWWNGVASTITGSSVTRAGGGGGEILVVILLQEVLVEEEQEQVWNCWFRNR